MLLWVSWVVNTRNVSKCFSADSFDSSVSDMCDFLFSLNLIDKANENDNDGLFIKG